MTTYTMFATFVQCMVIICWTSQKVVDFLIPMLLMPAVMLKESVMMGLLIHVMQGKDKGFIIKYKINQNTVLPHICR